MGVFTDEPLREALCGRQTGVLAVEFNNLTRELDAADSGPPDDLELRRLKKTLRSRIDEFSDLMQADVPQARQALRKLLDGPIRFHPIAGDGRKTYTFEGNLKVGPLLDPVYLGVASPRGFVSNVMALRLPLRGTAAA